MSAAITAGPPDRHPWIARFLDDPQRGYAELVAGYADIHPYQRADAPDAARLLFGPLAADDPARAALDSAVLAWLEAWRKAAVPADAGPRQRWVRQLSETLEIVYLLELGQTAVALRRRRLVWEDFCARHVLAPSRDARAMLWRAMALTQGLAHARDAGIPAQGLQPLWHTLCREAGAALEHRYLAIGLLGLRRLPGAVNELPWLAGLAHWAQARSPSTAQFRAEWLALKPLYPRNPGTWRDLVAQLLDTPLFRGADMAPPTWWGDADADLKPRLRAPGQREPVRLRSPGPRACEAVLEQMSRPFAEVRAAISDLLQRERSFLTSVADPQFFVRTVHRLGAALLERGGDEPMARAALAEALAREALVWEPNNGFLWSVWLKALTVQRRLAAAELVGWEAVRRRPDQADRYNQLALLLARLPQRRREAEALLRETIDRFPKDAPARNQLAELLIAEDRAEDAMAVIDAAFAAEVVGEVSFGIHARLLAHAGQHAAAVQVVAEGLQRYPQDPYLAPFAQRLARGNALPWVADELRTPLDEHEDTTASDPDLDRAMALGRLRRLRFRLDHAEVLGAGAMAELAQAVADDPWSSYARLLAVRAGIPTAVGDGMPGFAVAFEAALLAEDQAALAALALRMPRLRALTLVAQSLFGDAAAAAEMTKWLSADPPSAAAPAERSLHGGLRAIRGSAQTAGALVRDRRAAVLRVVHDATEATIGDALLAA